MRGKRPVMPAARLRLEVAYEGNAFSGWQSQSHGRSVQDALERAFAVLCGKRVVVHGAGRTDAGVHAFAQTAHADVPPSRIPLAGWIAALNGNLPQTVRVMRVRRVGEDFHARFSASGKIYRYSIYSGDILPPLELGRVWHRAGSLDPAALRAALAPFVGRRDFAAFSASRGTPVTDTVRTIRSVGVVAAGRRIRITIEGDGFLYKMVRMMVASAVRVAAGAESIDWIPSLLAGGGRCSHVAPASGLALVRVLYGPKNRPRHSAHAP